jgi:uncharacterized protein YjiS (DUF1127 family)
MSNEDERKPHNGGWPGRLFRLLVQWDARYSQRIALLELDARLLEDAGIDYEQSRHECRKWFWEK